MADVNFERVAKDGTWRRNSRSSKSGCCFTVSFDRLQAVFQKTGIFSSNETVEKIIVGVNGITVYTEGGDTYCAMDPVGNFLNDVPRKRAARKSVARYRVGEFR
jgi:hypothetical protein